jgi:hypothetical protein
MTALSQTPAATPAEAALVPATARLRGVVLVVLGAFLAVTCAIISVDMLPLFLNPGHTQDGTTFAGTAEQGIFAVVLMPLLSLLGVVFVIGGVQLFKYGRYFKRFGLVALALTMVIVVGGLRLGRHMF